MTRTSIFLAALVALVLAPACLSAQTPGSRSFRAVTTSVPQVETASVRELTIQWTTTPPAAGAQGRSVDAFTLIRQRTSNGGLRRERQPELSADQIVVVVQNAAGRELDWRLAPNTRIVRAEAPGADGRLAGQVMERPSAELLVTIPDVPGADRIRLYRPVWTGKEYTLEPLADVVIGSAR